MYQPAPAQPHRGGLVIATREGYAFGSFRWFGSEGRVTFFPDRVPRGDWTAAEVRRAMADSRVRDYLVWSRFPFVRTEPTPAGAAVFFGDARYTNGPSGGSLRGIRVVVGE
jgi:hypothetical protein